MQKKLIALAVAGLVSGGAFAQSNVTLYGIADVNVNSLNTGFGSKFTVGSGGLSASRLGFRGQEDLGNGMKAVFTLEAGLNIDTAQAGAAAPTLGVNQGGAFPGGASTSAANGTGSQLFARQSFAGVEGNYGSLTFGRQYTGSYIGLAVVIDPVGGGLYGGPLVTGTPTGITSRFSNSVVYKTPTMSGFRGHFSWTAGSENNTSGDVNSAAVGACAPATATCTNDKAGRGYDLAVMYGNGPLNALLSTWDYYGTTYAAVGGETGLAKRQGWALAGNYDFGVVKLHGGYIAGRIRGGEYETVTVSNNKNAMWSLGLVWPVSGAGRVVVNATGFNDKSVADRDFKVLGLSYLHDLSKRTTAYVNYGKLTNNGNSFASLQTGGDVLGATINPGSNTAGGLGYDPSGLMLGVRHSF